MVRVTKPTTNFYLKLFQNICSMKNQAFSVYNDFLSHVSLILSPPPFSGQHGHRTCAVATIMEFFYFLKGRISWNTNHTANKQIKNIKWLDLDHPFHILSPICSTNSMMTFLIFPAYIAWYSYHDYEPSAWSFLSQDFLFQFSFWKQNKTKNKNSIIIKFLVYLNLLSSASVTRSHTRKPLYQCLLLLVLSPGNLWPLFNKITKLCWECMALGPLDIQTFCRFVIQSNPIQSNSMIIS